MELVRIGALGGLDENGKNMYLIEINQVIFVVECGLKYPGSDQLGIEYIIPDFSYLVENKDRVKGIFITHGHDDVMGALKHLVKVVKAPIFTTPLTAKLIQDYLGDDKETKVKVLKRNGDFRLEGINFKTFGLTHSIPDAFGLAFETTHGYVVFASEFIIDMDVTYEEFKTDITTLAAIGKKHVLALMSESSSAERKGFTAPAHRITSKIEQYFQDAKGRIFITLYHQNIYRLIEIIELVSKFKKRIYIKDPGLVQILTHMANLGYYKIPKGLELPAEQFDNSLDDLVIVVSGQGVETFNKMHAIAIGDDPSVELRDEDTVIIASPIVHGTDLEAGKMENELYKEGVNVRSLNRKDVFSMHPSADDIKMLNYLFKPDYYMPISGEYRQLVENANLARQMDFPISNILVLDKGQLATFKDGRLMDTATWVSAEDVMIDGSDNLDSGGMVLRDREILSKDGVIIVGIALDFNTKAIIGGPDVQTRGVIYLKDADYIVQELAEIIINSVNNAVLEGTYTNASCRLEVKEKVTKYILKETGKRPMVLPTIIETRV
jgi:ribonuclease J